MAPATLAASIEAQLRAVLTPTELEVLDESAAHAGQSGSNGLGFGTHFRVRIAAPGFAGLSRVAKHRLVYDALQKFTEAGMHALAIEIKA